MDWYGDSWIAEVEKKLGDNLERAAIHLKNEVKQALNTTQPYHIVGRKGRYYKGDDPSAPGQAPKKIRGDLQRSIAHEMSPDRLTAYVGSNLDYSLYLEYGTYKLQPRPFFRPTLDREQDNLDRIITEGLT